MKKQDTDDKTKKAMTTYKPLVLFSQLSISLAVPLVLSMFIGIELDKWLSSKPTWTLIFLVIGFGASFRTMYRLLKPFWKDKE